MKLRSQSQSLDKKEANLTMLIFVRATFNKRESKRLTEVDPREASSYQVKTIFDFWVRGLG